MKSPLILALCAALAPLASAAASEQSYNFVEFGGAVTESSAAGPSLHGNGLRLAFGAGYSFGFVAGDYSAIELDGDDEVTLRSIQLGGHYPVIQSDTFELDLNAAASWESFTFEDAASSDTDAGFGGRLGARARFGERFDTSIYVGAADLDEDISLILYGLGAQVHMSEHIAVSLEYRFSELEATTGSTVDTDQTSLSARILF